MLTAILLLGTATTALLMLARATSIAREPALAIAKRRQDASGRAS